MLRLRRTLSNLRRLAHLLLSKPISLRCLQRNLHPSPRKLRKLPEVLQLVCKNFLCLSLSTSNFTLLDDLPKAVCLAFFHNYLLNMDANFNILQWNCRSLVRHYFKSCFGTSWTHKIQLRLLSETHLDACTITFFNYDIIFEDRNRYRSRVAILIRKGLKLHIVQDHVIHDMCQRNNVECFIAKIYLTSNNHIYVTSIYSSPRCFYTYYKRLLVFLFFGLRAI